MFTNFHLSGRAAEPAACEMSKQRLQRRTGVDMNLFMVKRTHPQKGPASPLCLPGEQTFMKTFPQNRYNSITIPSSRYLRHDCICCSANPPTNPQAIPTHCTAAAASRHLLYPANVTKQGEGECSVCMSFGMCGEALSSSTFFTPVLHSQSGSIHQPPRGRQPADLQLWQSNL